MHMSHVDIIHDDLNYICHHLAAEFRLLSGHHLLMTGGAGFLGYYMIQALLHWNHTHDDVPPIHVTVYDNYIRGIPEWLCALSEDQHLDLVKHDITDPLPANIGDYQYIIHAASIASPIYYRTHPIATMDANVNGLRHLLEYSRQQQYRSCPVQGFLFFSTSEIYGDPAPSCIPTPEHYRGNVSCTGPRACYDESKRYGETLCVNFAQQYDLPICMARPFNNYGPGLKLTDRRVLPDFVRDVLSGHDIVMFSDGSPTRTFCYIADAVVGYFKILTRGKPGEAYNIGVETPEISIAKLAERIVQTARELWNYQGKVIRQMNPDENYLVDNPNRRCPQITKARNELEYNPTISLEVGLKRSLIWYDGNREGGDA